ncbi:hypothetical protein K523DRAFT_321926, partial [Schizophyllum commune Tattone D]
MNPSLHTIGVPPWAPAPSCGIDPTLLSSSAVTINTPLPNSTALSNNAPPSAFNTSLPAGSTSLPLHPIAPTLRAGGRKLLARRKLLAPGRNSCAGRHPNGIPVPNSVHARLVPFRNL